MLVRVLRLCFYIKFFFLFFLKCYWLRCLAIFQFLDYTLLLLSLSLIYVAQAGKASKVNFRVACLMPTLRIYSLFCPLKRQANAKIPPSGDTD